MISIAVFYFLDIHCVRWVCLNEQKGVPARNNALLQPSVSQWFYFLIQLYLNRSIHEKCCGKLMKCQGGFSGTTRSLAADKRKLSEIKYADLTLKPRSWFCWFFQLALAKSCLSTTETDLYGSLTGQGIQWRQKRNKMRTSQHVLIVYLISLTVQQCNLVVSMCGNIISLALHALYSRVDLWMKSPYLIFASKHVWISVFHL